MKGIGQILKKIFVKEFVAVYDDDEGSWVMIRGNEEGERIVMMSRKGSRLFGTMRKDY
jgi:hypothetical protein